MPLTEGLIIIIQNKTNLYVWGTFKYFNMAVYTYTTYKSDYKNEITKTNEQTNINIHFSRCPLVLFNL